MRLVMDFLVFNTDFFTPYSPFANRHSPLSGLSYHSRHTLRNAPGDPVECNINRD